MDESTDEYGATPLIIGTYLGNYESVQQLFLHPNLNKSLTFENKTALQYAQPNERATTWSFLEGRINMEGRQKILQLFQYQKKIDSLFNTK
mgnify:CR=1 FL=1